MPTYRGSCHCGAVEIEVDGEAEVLTTCTCSLCSRRNALMYRVHEDRLKVLKGQDNLTLYRFGTGAAAHYFCRTCGIYTHHRTRRLPEYFAVNARCLEGLDIDAMPVERFDGRNAF